MSSDKIVTHVLSEIEEIAEEMCEHYCKYAPDEPMSKEAMDKLMEEHCDKCPLNRL